MTQSAPTAHPIDLPWSRSDVQQYRRENVKGEYVGPLGDLDLEHLPWDSAPRVEACNAEQETDDGIDNIVCVKRSRSRCVLTFLLYGQEGRSVRLYAKRCHPRKWSKRLLGRIRSGKSEREWDLGWNLLERGIPTALPLLWAERSENGTKVENYLLTLGIERSVSFYHLWKSLPDSEQRSEWMKRFGNFVRITHDRGFAHDDFSAHHVLVCMGESAPELYLIDLDQSRIGNTVSPYRRAHNFFQFFRSMPKGRFSNADRKTFYDGYSDGKWSESHCQSIETAISRIAWLKRLACMVKHPFSPAFGECICRRTPFFC